MTKPRYRVKAQSRHTAEIAYLPVVPLFDLDAKKVLADAAESNLLHVVVCGIDADGQFTCWGSATDNAASLMLVERAKAHIVQAERDNGWRPVSGGGDVVRLPRSPT